MIMLLNRSSYFLAKIRRAWRDGTLVEKARRCLMGKVRIPLGVGLRYLHLPKVDRRLTLEEGFADHRQKNNHHCAQEGHLRRIIASYKAAKRAEAGIDEEFRIRGLWSEWIDVNYRRLIAALENEDLEALGALYDNFNREQFAVGTGGSGYDAFVKYKTALMGRPYIKTIWCDYRDRYLSFGSALEDVGMPLIGNPAGIPLNGDVIQINTFRHAYHAAEMIQLLRDVPGAAMVEIGSGFGGQAYQTIQRAKGSVAKYLCFDIPEVASVCAYYLLSAFPEKRIRLFGEGPVSTAETEEYDLAVFPHFAITELANDSVDLFHNANSFSEMDSASSSAYLRVMERACRGHISHINHEVSFKFRSPNGSISTNIIGSNLLPDPSRFKLAFKKPRVFTLPEDVFFPSFEYLYERKNASGQRYKHMNLPQDCMPAVSGKQYRPSKERSNVTTATLG